MIVVIHRLLIGLVWHYSASDILSHSWSEGVIIYLLFYPSAAYSCSSKQIILLTFYHLISRFTLIMCTIVQNPIIAKLLFNYIRIHVCGSAAFHRAVPSTELPHWSRFTFWQWFWDICISGAFLTPLVDSSEEARCKCSVTIIIIKRLNSGTDLEGLLNSLTVIQIWRHIALSRHTFWTVLPYRQI